MSWRQALLLAAGLAIVPSGRAQAGEVDFGYSYGAETADPGETEVTLWATDRNGKRGGHYDAQDYRLEIERGITSRFQMSLYANFTGHHVRRLQPAFEAVNRDVAFQGLSAEFKYAVAPPTPRGIGFALYAEPGWSRIDRVSGEHGTEYELELKAIAQKNFARDRLIWVGNLTLEPEWEHERAEASAGGDEAEWEKELKVELTTGLAYRVAPRWSVGAEARYASVYPNWTHGLHRAAYAVSAGPMIHFSAGEFGLTATWLPQLFGGADAPGAGLNLDEYEKSEVRVKLGYEF
jgi:hypothetical protein